MVTEAQRQFMADRAHLPTRTLARIMCEEFPDSCKNMEQTRDAVRYYRQEKGEECRGKVSRSGKAVPVTKYSAPDPAKLEYQPYILPAVGKGLMIADLHIPYHDKAALDTAINHAIKQSHTDHLIILGDMLDFYQASKFCKDPRKFNLPLEVEMGTKFLEDMTNIFDRVVYKTGNHEERIQHYQFTNAPALVGLPGSDFVEIMDIEGLGIDHVRWCDPIFAGDNLTLIHGHEYGRSMFSPVNAARGLFMRALACSVTAHYHRTSHHDEPDVRGKDISTWSIGCLCNLHPEYARLNKWNHGFALFNFEGGDDWDISNHRIVNGHVR